MATRNGQQRWIVDHAKEIGFVLEKITRKCHLRFRHKDNGAIVICSSSASDSRSLKNTLAEMRRHVRRPKQERGA